MQNTCLVANRHKAANTYRRNARCEYTCWRKRLYVLVNTTECAPSVPNCFYCTITINPLIHRDCAIYTLRFSEQFDGLRRAVRLGEGGQILYCWLSRNCEGVRAYFCLKLRPKVSALGKPLSRATSAMDRSGREPSSLAA